ncbi:aryl-alcohol dehydrogenase [Coprinellus micaceus]|uniref:Aryl-alcohol dehydrogenase n=1 Tax=Coprinellus micaceus TaxID=71717 RepID=A0A4Y7TJL0_COPMI|nr:aryl-alcohol dehydrogenase [Coprinellus micaceus]
MSSVEQPAVKRAMPYVRIGKSGLKVSKIILGTMQYGSSQWQSWVLDDEEEMVRHVKVAYEAGVNAFDTANVYSNGLAEIYLGRTLKKLNIPRENVVIMTKCYAPVAKNMNEMFFDPANPPPQEPGYINQHGLSRKNIFASVKASLERLQVDYIDLFQCHRVDYETPIEETMQALHDVVQTGLVRYIGMSSCFAWQFHVMQNYAISKNLTPFISMQNHHNLVYREEEREMFPSLKHFGVGAIPWSPIARGLLTRPWAARNKGTKRGETDQYTNGYLGAPGTEEIINRVEEISKRKGVSMAQVACAWSMAKEGVTAPIVGTTSLKNLEDLLASVHIKLTDEEIKYLEEPYKPTEVFGHW